MPGELVVDFDVVTQSLTALHRAAYRLAGVGTCQIGKDRERYTCHLAAIGDVSSDALRIQFLQIVADENVRETLHTKTEPVRNLILSLAFGALADQTDNKDAK